LDSYHDIEKELIYLGLLEKAREIYAELGETAVLSYVKSSYRLLSKVYHPDLNPKNKEKARIAQQRLNRFSRLLSRIADNELIELMEKGMNKDSRGKHKILIVEDKLELQKLFKNVLLAEGYDIRISSDGASGYETFCQFRPEVVLTDIEISGMTGLELVRKMRTMFPSIKAIFIIGFLGVETLKRELENEIQQYGYGTLEKPFKISELLDLVRVFVHEFQNIRTSVSVYA
jgi:CheY-like chemotaxis protein